MNFQSHAQVDNQSENVIRVVIEPWGDVLRLDPGSSFSIVAESPLEGKLELVQDEDGDFAVYGWPGSTCRVLRNEQLVQAYLQPVPGLPPGWSMRRFVGRIFKGE